MTPLRMTPQVRQALAIARNLRQVRDRPFELVNEHYFANPDLARIPLGFVDLYAVGRPEYIQRVANDPELIKPRLARRLMTPMLGNGLFISEGGFWKRQRRAMAPMFRPCEMGKMMPGMADVAAEFRARLLRQPHVDLVREVTRVTIEILMKTVFGVHGDVRVGGLHTHLEVLSRQYEARVRNLWPPPLWLPTESNRELRQHIREVKRMVWELIDVHDRDTSGKDETTLISALRRASAAADARMTEQEVFDEVATFFLAGHETTAMSLFWCLYLLSKHPAAQHRLQQELNEFGPPPYDFAQLSQMPYLQAVIDETLRLYPPGYTAPREVASDAYALGEQRIRRGSLLFIPIYAIHRNPARFTDPDAFRPERWLEGAHKRLPRNHYLPFGAGKRSCIGEHFARLEMQTVLATLYRRAGTRLAQGARTPSVFAAITLRPSCTVRLAAEEAAQPDVRQPCYSSQGSGG